MERLEDAKTLQGGGSGQGLKDMDQLRNEIYASRRRIEEHIIADEKRRDIQGTFYLKMLATIDAEIWKQQLSQRFQAIGAPFQSEEERPSAHAVTEAPLSPQHKSS